jgi:hypothetical protein
MENCSNTVPPGREAGDAARPEPATAPSAPPAADRAPRPLGFSLASIFLLTALVAVMAAAMRSAATHPKVFDEGPAAFGTVAGLFVGLVAGAVAGLRSRRRVAGVLAGVPLGMMVGAVCGVVSFSPPAFHVLIVGAVLLPLVAVAIRLLSRRP